LILRSGGKVEGHLGDTLVRVRAPDFEGVGHTHPVNLDQDVVGQVIMEVEPHQPGDIIDRGRFPKTVEEDVFLKTN